MPEPLVLTARAALFDMDGTLVDSTAVVEAEWRRLAELFGADADEVLASIHGVRAADSIRRFAPPGADIEQLVADLADYELRGASRTEAIPGAVELLNTLPLPAHALVTSASLPLAVARMRGAGVRLPHFVVTAEDVAHGKPAPDVYLLAAGLLDVEPHDAVVFEDAEAGIQAGLAAGMRVVVVGDHVSPAAPDLPRIADYRGASVARGPDGLLRMAFPAAR